MTRRLSRRAAIGLGLVGIGAASVGAMSLSEEVNAAFFQAPPTPAPLSVDLSRRIRLHLVQTGWVAVKTPHRAYSGPSALRVPAIMASRSWTEWLPVTAFVVEHPEALILVDTGETARITERNYASCDPITGAFYRRNLRFDVAPSQEIGAQMNSIGLDPRRVTEVVMTHLHSDHMGGMGTFPMARFHVSAAARQGHTGALMCRIPPELNLQSTRLEERRVGVFGQTASVTRDGTISIVPTPGHAKGHQSVMIEDEGRSVCIVGDAAFDEGQILSGQMAGIVEQPAEARQTLARLKDQRGSFGTLMLPTHDPDNRKRLAAL